MGLPRIRARFELFTGISLAAHLALVAGVVVKRPATESGAGSSTNTGTSASIGGETFEVPDLEETPPATNPGTDEPDIELDPKTDALPANAEPSGIEPPRPATHGASHPRASHHGGPAAPPPPPEPAAYGALGDRSAGDLIATFKRAFPEAVGHEPLWSQIPIGFQAAGDVTFTLEPDGSLASDPVIATNAPEVRRVMQKTVVLLRHRLFTARGRRHAVARGGAGHRSTGEPRRFHHQRRRLVRAPQRPSRERGRQREVTLAVAGVCAASCRARMVRCPW